MHSNLRNLDNFVSASSRVHRYRALLVVTTAMVSLHAGAAFAGPTTVNVTSPEPASTLNAQIVNAENTPSSDISVTVTAPAVISGNTDVTLFPLGTGKGDGAISFANTGNFGAIDAAGTVTDSVGINLNGVGGKAAGNTLTLANSGLVTDGINASDFGGNVSITNSGTVYGSLTGTGYGNVTVSTSSGGAIVSGFAAEAVAYATASAVTTAGVNTTSYTGGNAEVDQNGNALQADGTTPATLEAFSEVGNSTVRVGAKAGNVYSIVSAFTPTSTVFVSQPAVLSATTTTYENDASYGMGASLVDIASTGSVTGIDSQGSGGGSSVVVSGKVGTGGIQSISEATDSTYKITETDDATGETSSTRTQSQTKSGGDASVQVDSTGTVGSFINSTGDKSASVVANGNVQGPITASQNTGSNTTDSETDTFANGESVIADSTTLAPGTASIAIGKNVTIGGSLSASSNGDATITTATGSVVDGSVSINTQPGSNRTSTSDYVQPASPTNDYTSTAGSTTTTAGGTATFTNAGYVAGPVSIYATTGATVTNSGQVTGQTYVGTYGSQETDSSTGSQVTSTAGGITTITTSGATSEKVTGLVGDIIGTYSGTNGQVSFSPNTPGDITQSASRASTVNASGTVYGSINSYAGEGSNWQDATTASDIVTTDGAPPPGGANGTETKKNTDSYSQSSLAGGQSTVTVSGLVSNAFAGVNVTSEGTTGSIVNIAGGTVQGSVYSYADGDYVYQTANETDVLYVTTKGVSTQTHFSQADSETYTLTGGAAAATVTGAGNVTGNLYAQGVSSASSQIDAGANVHGSLNVSAYGNDYTSSDSTVRTYDPSAKAATYVYKDVTVNTPSVVTGNASANVDGKIGGFVDVNAGLGNASASIQGVIGGSVTAVSGTGYNSYSDEVDEAGTSLATLIETKEISTNSTTYAGGVASITVDTSAAWQKLGYGIDADVAGMPSITGSVYASGLGGANVTIAAGSLVGGSITANSDPYNVTNTTETDYNATGTSGTRTTTFTSTPVGSAATVVNNGTVGGAFAYGLTVASVTNNGTVLGDIGAQSLDWGTTSTSVDNDFGNLNPATRTQVTTVHYTPVGGVASIVNGTMGDLEGNAYLAGATGTLTNNGKINGNIYLGFVVPSSYQLNVDSTTTGSPPPTYTPPSALFAQTYTVNQNGTVVGDTHVTGADFSYTDGAGVVHAIQTSTVNATINLNAGSSTIGSVYGDDDTNTVVNLNTGSVMQGSFFEGENASVDVNLNGGQLVLTGTKAAFSLNVNSGQTQITPIYSPTGTLLPYNLTGDVTVGNNGELVLGLLHTNVPAVDVAGLSITKVQPTVEGANLAVSGNFTSTGTVTAGLNGSLVQSPVFAASLSTDFWAPVTTVIGSYGSAYTTPEAAALAGNPINTPSTVTVGGNLNLGGTIKVYVPQGSIFLGNENETLFTAGGTITDTASVTTNMNSAFVTFSAATSGNSVVLKASRASYATAATNPNAAAAAAALDKAIPNTVKVLTDDAAGKRDYTSLDQFSKVEDMANVIANLDWNASKAQAGEIFNELSSASIYGSLANLRQNVAFDAQLDQLVERRDSKDPSVGLWFNPIGNFAKYGGTSSGASKIDATSYGAAAGLDVGYGDNGAFGFGFGYTKHNVNAVGTAATADATTYTLGAYWTQGFGPIAAYAKFDYGLSVFDAQRDLASLSRTVNGHFRGNEWDGSLGLSYTLSGGGVDFTPFGELALRHWHMGGFDETGGAAFGLAVDGASKSVFDPSVGVRLTTLAKDSGAFQLRPYGSLSYTFQGNAGTSRTVRYLGDLTTADSFVLDGVNPKGYATVGAGITALVANKVSVSLGGSYGFGGDNSVGTVRGLIAIKF